MFPPQEIDEQIIMQSYLRTAHPGLSLENMCSK